MNCPDCGSNRISYSHRRGTERFFRYIFPKRPYRCKECWSRFWVFENPLKTWQSKVIAGSIICFLIFILALPLFWSPNPPQEERKETRPPVVESRQAERKNTRRPSISVTSSRAAQPSPTDSADNASTEPTPALPFTTEDIGPGRSGEQAGDAGAPPASETGSDESRAPAFPQENAGGVDGSSLSEPPSPSAEAVVTPTSQTTIASTMTSSPAAPGGQEDTASSSQTNVPKASAATPLPSQPETSRPASRPKQKEPLPGKKPLFSKPKLSKLVVVTPEKLKEPKKKKIKKHVLNGIRIKPSTVGFYALLQADPPFKYSVSNLPRNQAEPPKIIVDIDGKWQEPKQSVYDVYNRWVKQVRVGVHSEFLRVVLDMRTKTSLKPHFSESAEGLSISLRP